MAELLTTLAVFVVLFAGTAIALYFLVRWLFMRAADRAARQFELLLNRMAGSPRVAAAGRMASSVAGYAHRANTNFARYAQVAGTDEAGARREFQESIERLAHVMDTLVKVPLLGAVGFDALLGLFPFVGDATSAVVSLTLIARSLKYGLPRELVAKMLANVLVDVILGAVPLVGDLADVWFRANAKNAALVREFLEKKEG